MAKQCAHCQLQSKHIANTKKKTRATATNNNCWKFNWKNNDRFVLNSFFVVVVVSLCWLCISLKMVCWNWNELQKKSSTQHKNKHFSQVLLFFFFFCISVCLKSLHRIMCSKCGYEDSLADLVHHRKTQTTDHLKKFGTILFTLFYCMTNGQTNKKCHK